MAVSDPQDLLSLELSPIPEKYDELTRIFYLKGRPELKGDPPVRLLDSLLLRSMGLILSFGENALM